MRPGLGRPPAPSLHRAELSEPGTPTLPPGPTCSEAGIPACQGLHPAQRSGSLPLTLTPARPGPPRTRTRHTAGPTEHGVPATLLAPPTLTIGRRLQVPGLTQGGPGEAAQWGQFRSHRYLPPSSFS